MNLYVSDLDGTLLNSDGVLSEFTLEKINQLIDKGVNFTVASARSIVSIKEKLKGIDFKLPIIEMNGAFISDFKTSKHYIINNIEDKIVSEILSIIQKHKLTPFISSFNGEYDHLYYNDVINDGMQWYYNDKIINNDKRLRHKEDLSEVLCEDIITYTVIARQEELIPLKEELTCKFQEKLEIHIMENYFSPGWYWLTIHDVKATKAHAIKALCEKFNYCMDNLYVFGDNHNDIHMFKLAKYSIAVENAKDDLKDHSSEIIGKNNDDSVMKFIFKNEFGIEI